MAITVHIFYTGQNGSARRFAEEMVSSGTEAGTGAHAASLRYDYFFPQHDPESVRLIDSWAGQEALDVHHASPMMGQIAALRDKYDLHMKVERYRSDDAGLPARDAGFIRQ